MGSGSSGGEDLADDGKRLDALDVAVQGRRLFEGGSLREGVDSRFSGAQDLADDGKRSDAVGVLLVGGVVLGGEGARGRGGVKGRSGNSAGG